MGLLFLLVLHTQHTHTHVQKPTYNTQVATDTDKTGQIGESLSNPPESEVEEETEISCCLLHSDANKRTGTSRRGRQRKKTQI